MAKKKKILSSKPSKEIGSSENEHSEENSETSEDDWNDEDEMETEAPVAEKQAEVPTPVKETSKVEQAGVFPTSGAKGKSLTKTPGKYRKFV